MKSTVLSSVEPLLYGLESPRGAIELVMFAKKMANSEGIENCNRLAKLSFNNSNIHKAFPDELPFDETLLIGYEGWSELILYLCIKCSRKAVKIATCQFPNGEIRFYDDYRNTIMLRKLSENEIKEIFCFVWDNLELIQPKPLYMMKDE